MAHLHHEQTGAGPPVVLIHAGICDSGMWDPQWRSLAGSHRLLRLDLRGFGRSPLQPEPYSNARDVLDVMDAAGVERAALVGASLGGSVALEAAVAAPERVSALVLACSGLPAHEWSPDVRAYWAAEEAAIERGDLEAAAEANVGFWIGPADAAVRAQVHAMQLRALELQVPVGDDDPEVPLVADLNARLGEIAVPALVVVGALDHPDIRSIAARLVAALPHATRAEIAAAAHLPSLEQPAAFDAAVAPLLALSGARA